MEGLQKQNVNTEKFQSYISSLETTDKGLKHKCLSAFPPQIGSLSSRVWLFRTYSSRNTMRASKEEVREISKLIVRDLTPWDKSSLGILALNLAVAAAVGICCVNGTQLDPFWI